MIRLIILHIVLSIIALLILLGISRAIKTEKKMHMQPVKSGHIKAIGYDAATKQLRVQFKNGDIWAYPGVDEHTHRQLMGADSIGSFYAGAIKGVYDGFKLS